MKYFLSSFKWLAAAVIGTHLLLMIYLYYLDHTCNFTIQCKTGSFLVAGEKLNVYFRGIYVSVSGYQWRIIEKPESPFVEWFLLFAHDYASPVIVHIVMLIFVYFGLKGVQRLIGSNRKIV
jgi:hypothetical protein